MPLKGKRAGGSYCAIFNCSNSSGKLQAWKKELCEVHGNFRANCCVNQPYQMHRFPKDKETLAEWKIKIRREKFCPNDRSRVCSIHFIDGKPTITNPYPVLALGYTVPDKKKRPAPKERTCQPAQRKVDNNEQIGIELHSQNQECQTNIVPATRDIGIQVNNNDFSCSRMDSGWVEFYTGINLVMFFAILGTFQQSISSASSSKLLKAEDQLLLILTRLRLNVKMKDLAFRFRITLSACSKIFSTGIVVLSEILRDATLWLPRTVIRATMPKQFIELFPKTTCIIDCSEVFTQRPSSLFARAMLYSNYKAHNTVKFLLGIAPNGLIMYLSPCYGGRASDKFICTDSGFFNYLESGDEVMADRGFGIEQELAERGVSLNIPAFARGRKLSKFNCTKTRRIASVRIHVERVIGRMKHFNILRSVLPITAMKNVDHIISVCAALTNLRPPIIKSKQKFKVLN